MDSAEIVGAAIGIVALVAGVFFLAAFLVMVLWGATASIFGFMTIGFWDACIITLAILMIGSLLNSVNFTSSSKKKE